MQCPRVEGDADGGATVVEVLDVEVVSVVGGDTEVTAVCILQPRAGGAKTTGLEIGFSVVVVVTGIASVVEVAVGIEVALWVVEVLLIDVEVVLGCCEIDDDAKRSE